MPPRVIDSPGVVGANGAKREPKWSYYLRKTYNVAVYDVVVLFRAGPHSLGTDPLDVLAPSDEPMTRKVPTHVKREARVRRDEHGEAARPFISFSDAAGRNWRRTAADRLLRSILRATHPTRKMTAAAEHATPVSLAGFGSTRARVTLDPSLSGSPFEVTGRGYRSRPLKRRGTGRT